MVEAEKVWVLLPCSGLELLKIKPLNVLNCPNIITEYIKYRKRFTASANNCGFQFVNGGHIEFYFNQTHFQL